MFPAVAAVSNSTSLSEETSFSSRTRVQDFNSLNPPVVSTLSPPPPQQQQEQKIKKKRSLPGNPDPDAEVIALSPKTLLATNRFVCEICNKGFPRDQNLQLHRRGHNLPWKLKQRNNKDVKKRAYVCPEPSCVHHHPSRALGDLTGIKKHYCRKHGEKKWKCEKCSKIYAVQSDWKAHSKTCGTREYRCDCGTLFSRKDSFITHRAFCDALAEESARLQAHQLVSSNSTITTSSHSSLLLQTHNSSLFPLPSWDPLSHQNPNTTNNNNPLHSIKAENFHLPPPSPLLFQEPPPALPVPPATTHKHGATTTFITTTSLPFQNHLSSAATSAPQQHLSATALLQEAATVGSFHSMGHTHMSHLDMGGLGSVSQVVNDSSNCLGGLATWQKRDRLTRDFLGLAGDDHHHHHNCNGTGATNNTGCGGGAVDVSMNVREMLTYTGGVGFQQQPYERDQSLVKPHGVGFGRHHPASETWGTARDG